MSRGSVSKGDDNLDTVGVLRVISGDADLISLIAKQVLAGVLNVLLADYRGIDVAV